VDRSTEYSKRIMYSKSVTTTTASILIQFTQFTEVIGIFEIFQKDSRKVRFITLRLRVGRE